MKPPTYLLLLGGLLIASLCQAQAPDRLQQAVGLQLPSLPMIVALDSLSAHLGLSFSYDVNTLPTEREVAIKHPSSSLAQVLDRWLKNTELRYRLIGNQVVLYRPHHQNSKRINGFIKEQDSQKPLPYTQILVAGTQDGAVANQTGYFSILVERFPITLEISRLGYKTERIVLEQVPKNNLELQLAIQNLEIETVEIQAEALVKAEAAGHLIIGSDFIEAVPSFAGERDVVKALQYLPGVQRANEGNNSLFVRGGNGDQNLILLDEVPIYNVNHLFGFMSVFNGDAIQNVEFIKGGFPAHYGGRLSSVMAVSTKEGSREKWGAKGAIGLTSSRLLIGGPLFNKKASLLLSARRTFWDMLIRPAFRLAYPFNPEAEDFGQRLEPFFFFHDYNAKFCYTPNKRDKLSISLYSSWDRYATIDRYIGQFRNGEEDHYAINWGNLNASLRWDRAISPKVSINTTFFTTNYRVNFSVSEVTGSESDSIRSRNQRNGSQIFDLALKHDIYWTPNSKHDFRAGAIISQHIFTPNYLYSFRRDIIDGIESINIGVDEEDQYSAQEAAIYVEDCWSPTSKLSLELGLRLSAYAAESRFRMTPEPRIKLQYRPLAQHQFEFSLSRTAQYLHRI
ncbi:MAG: TonB-dependent receptor, partial [Bacteroidota bacterium]